MTNVSICIIGKNEEKNIENCLKSIPKEEFEIIYVDTGSTDKTVALAEKYTDNIFHFKWIDDFSAARNFSLQQASNDWILVLDCDESITECNVLQIQQFTSSNPTDVGLIFRTNVTGEEETSNISYDLVKRLFNRKHYHYEGTIHEQVVSNNDSEGTTKTIPLNLYHTGYIGTIEERESKALRNIELLKKALDNNPDDPYYLFQLGQSYYFLEKYEESIPYFSKALTYDVDPKAQYVKLLVVSYGYSLANCGLTSDAIAIAEEVYSYFSNYADFVFLCGYLYMITGPWQKAVTQFKKCISLEDKNSDVITPARYNLGCIFEVVGDLKSALDYFLLVPDFKDSKAHITKLKSLPPA